MRPGGGHAKGAAFEREICESLSRWIVPEGHDSLFWRTAMSGGRHTIRRKQGKKDASQAADICAIDPRGNVLTDQFAIEAKFYAKLDIEAFLLKRAGKLHGFWEEIARLAKDAKKHPLLIAKQNRLDPLLISTPVGIELLGLYDFTWVAACAVHPCAHICWLESLEEIECPLGTY